MHSQFFDRKKIHKFLFIFLKEFDRKFYKIETVPLSNFVFRYQNINEMQKKKKIE